MEMFSVLTFIICLAIVGEINNSPLPGHHHVHHRIIVPQKIKTVYHTKIVKVPEHHHYFHEKEKIIQVEAPHHKDDHKPDYKDLKYPPYDPDDSFDDFSDFHSRSHGYGGERHNIFKKHAVAPKNRKRSRAQRKKQKEEEEE